MSIWYLSYAGETDFNGAVIVEADGFKKACLVAKSLGISPQDVVQREILGFELPSAPPERFMRRLLKKQDLVEMDASINLNSQGIGCIIRLDSGYERIGNDDASDCLNAYCRENLNEVQERTRS